MFKISRRTKFIAILLVLVLAMAACELPESGLPVTPPEGGEGPEEPAPTEVPPEVEPTEAPPEPEPTEAPPEVVPTEAPPEPAPPDNGGGTSQSDTTKILLVVLIVVVILGIGIIIAVILGGRDKAKPTTAAPTQPPPPQTVQDHLNLATPMAANLYQRFTELVQTFGAVEIVPTQTRIDFRVRVIFASVQFRQDSILVQLVLPQRLESPRVIRVDTYTQSSFANYLYIHSFEDYDAEFNAWLQEAYNLGVRGM
jgi:hypothetical protein